MNELSQAYELAPKAKPNGRVRRPLRLVAGLLVMGSIAAACGSGSGSSATSKPAAGAGGGRASTVAVDTAKNASLGTVLVNSKGFTLYRLSKDPMNKSVCTGGCRAIWPPLLMTGSGSPVAGSGVSGLGTIKVPGGEQVTYHGEALYTYSGDQSPGQANGQDLTDSWGTWFVVVTKAAPGATTTTGGGGGGVGF